MVDRGLANGHRAGLNLAQCMGRHGRKTMGEISPELPKLFHKIRQSFITNWGIISRSKKPHQNIERFPRSKCQGICLRNHALLDKIKRLSISKSELSVEFSAKKCEIRLRKMENVIDISTPVKMIVWSVNSDHWRLIDNHVIQTFAAELC